MVSDVKYRTLFDLQLCRGTKNARCDGARACTVGHGRFSFLGRSVVMMVLVGPPVMVVWNQLALSRTREGCVHGKTLKSACRLRKGVD
jgi:hypothetical protein